MIRLTFIQSSPTRDVRSPANEILVRLWNADGNDVGLELHRLVEPQQGQVVFEGPRIELGMGCHYLDSPLLMDVGFAVRGEIVLSQPEQQVARRDAKIEND